MREGQLFQQIFDVENSNDIVERSFIDGYPSAAGFHNKRLYFVPTKADIKRVEVAPRCHDCQHIGIAEFHHSFDHFAFFFF